MEVLVLYESKIMTLSDPGLKDPVLIQGLYLPGQASFKVMRLIREHSNPVKLAELYSPFFPDYVTAGRDGLCYLPRFEFSGSCEIQPNVLLLSGSLNLLPEGCFANYEVFTSILDYALSMGCERFICYGCLKGELGEENLYLAASSGKLASRLVGELGGSVFPRRGLEGSMGLLLGLARVRGLMGVCVIKPLADRIPGEVAALSIFNYILEVMELWKEKALD